MTQTADLPQLSLQRYFDLLKRRRWQLLPVSLLGLLIGGLVAFFIPRFFVAETLLSHQQLPGADVKVDKPFQGIVDSAKSTIPLAVADALDELAWPEVQALDPYSREQFNRAVETRVWVADQNAWDKKRNYAQLRVQYRDRDGERSAQFLNTLVRVWVEKRTQELREPAQEAAQQAKQKADTAGRIYDRLLGEKQDLERTYGIRPDFSLAQQQVVLQQLVAADEARAKELRDKRISRERLQIRLELEQELLDGLTQRVPPEAVRIEDQLANNPAAAPLAATLLFAQQAASRFRRGTRLRLRFLRLYEQTMVQIRQLVPAPAADPDGLVENPDYTAQRAKMELLDAEIKVLDAEIAVLDAAVVAEKKRVQDLIVGFGQYDQKLNKVAEAKARRESALSALDAANDVLSGLQRRLPVKQERIAQIPPEPTEPNIMVVAVIGCVLGLFAAIGLILLLDFAQGSFKTLDDVERGLTVPVLGGMSHIETDEERLVAVRSRRRVSLVAAALLVMVTMVVTLFYLVPTRLPPVVRDLLALVLGTGS